MRTSNSLSHLISIAALIALCAFIAPHSFAATLYIAPNGNDAWSGALAEPNAGGTDGPKATLTGARDALRALKAEAPLAEPAQVLIRQGVYHLTEPVIFTPEDSGTPNAPITYEAYPGEQPLFHGGRAITGWTQQDNLWVADIPQVREGTWDFSAFWVNGQRCQPARTPNPAHVAGDEPAEEDFFYTAGQVTEKDAEGKEQKSSTRFHYREGDIQNWPSLKDAIVVVFHSWATSLHRVKSLDEANRIVEFTGPARWPLGRWRSDQWYFIEHLFEALDQPGEWFLNREQGKLYYMPRPGEDMTTADAIAPVAGQMIRLDGIPAEGQFVSNLQFRGLSFAYTEYPIKPQGHSDGQAVSSVIAAFETTGARYCTIDRCAFAHLGTYGVWFRAGSQNNHLTHSEIVDTGAGGVRIGECASPATPDEAAIRNTVDNCFLHDGGRIFRSAVGFWIGRSSYNTVSHCEICDYRYSGMSIGWSWGFAESSAHHNIIEFNHVHHCGHGQLSDMGAIYSLGVSPGTIIRNNSFHDIMSNPNVSGGWGIYFDEGSSDILAENNLVYNCLTGTLHQHYGKDNRVRNNIFAYSHRGQLIRSREEDHISFFFTRNIVLFNNDQLLGSRWDNNNFYTADNCYWNGYAAEDMDFAGRTFAEWKAQGHDVRSIVADPLFVSPETGDFALKPGSPALGLGFQPIDLSHTGLYGEPEWVDKPKQIPREPFSPPEQPEPMSFNDDFESTEAGSVAQRAHTQGEEGDALIRVTTEIAASGEQCLKFTDAQGLAYAFNPYLSYSPRLRKGIARGAFAIRLEPGDVFFNEWRDSHSPYRIGPSIWFGASSATSAELKAGGNKLLDLPLGEWIHIGIEAPLGSKANGQWDLTVTLPGKEPQRFQGLETGHPQWRWLDWVGFVSNAEAPATTYIDDIQIGVK